MTSMQKLEAIISRAKSKTAPTRPTSSNAKKSVGEKAKVGARSSKAGAVKTKLKKAPSAAKPASKRDQLAALLVRDEGATIVEMQQATGWLPHTVRAALTGLKKLGYAIDSDKADGVRTYRAVSPK